MFLQESLSEFKEFQTKYPCIICFERVKSAVRCVRCNNMICFSHTKKVDDKCPYCRLSPFITQRDHFMDELIQVDRKRQQEFLIQTAMFTCLAEGCDFKGKFHKMDLHRRRFHRNQTLKEILFSQERQRGKKLRAVQLILKGMKKSHEEKNKWHQMAMILQNKSHNRIETKILVDMLKHVNSCPHNDCKKIYIEQSMAFIGNNLKEISNCPHSQKFLTFY